MEFWPTTAARLNSTISSMGQSRYGRSQRVHGLRQSILGRPVRRVLDIACGTGAAAIWLSDARATSSRCRWQRHLGRHAGARQSEGVRARAVQAFGSGVAHVDALLSTSKPLLDAVPGACSTIPSICPDDGHHDRQPSGGSVASLSPGRRPVCHWSFGCACHGFTNTIRCGCERSPPSGEKSCGYRKRLLSIKRCNAPRMSRLRHL